MRRVMFLFTEVRVGLALLAATVLFLVASAAQAAVPNIRLTNDAAVSQRPRVALDPSGNAVVVWQDARFGNDEILWQKFDQLGSPITPVVRVTNTSGTSARPDVACDASGISHIVWQEGDNVNGVGTVYFCRLDASGTKILNDLVVLDFGGRPGVAVAPDGATDLTFYRSKVTDFYVYYRRYSSAGTQVCQLTYDAGSLTQVEKDPIIVTSSTGNVNVFWRDLTSGFAYVLMQGAATTTCGKSSGIIYNNGSAIHPTMTIGGPYTFRMFEKNGDIYNLTGTNTIYKISQGAGQAAYPSVGADSHDGYVVWRDARDGNGEIYFARFWSDVNRTGDIRLTNEAAASETPDIAVDASGNGNWVSVWRDARDGNNEIYLTSRVLVDGPTPIMPASVQASVAGCPPAAHVTWIDQSTNETSFVVERDKNGDDVWLPGMTLPAGTQSWDDPTIAYGNAYRYRVKACNGTFCSDWAGSASLPVSEPILLREGLVKATILTRPYSDPILLPIPNARVSVYRDGAPIFSTYTDPTTGIYQLDVTMRCNDEIGVALEDDFRNFHVVDWTEHNVGTCGHAAVPLLKQPVGEASTIDFTWPVVGEGYSGDPVNVFYIYNRAVADYWIPQFGIQDQDWLEFYSRTNVPTVGGGMGVNPLGEAGKSCGSFQSGYGKYKSGILHEFGHRMISQKMAGPAIRENLDPAHHPEAAEAAALDEGLADFFAAATDEDPRIHTRLFRSLGVEVATVLRDLSKLKLYPWCNGAYATQDEHYGGWTLGGALWDLRERLSAIPGFDRFELDRTVYATIATLKDVPVGERTLRKFRVKLLETPLGQDHHDDFVWAFDRHNIKPTPDDACRPSPQVTAVSSTVEPAGRVASISWSSVPYAARYRLYVERFAQSTMGLGPGEVLADSLTDTTYTYTESDTTIILAFRVAAIDSSGDAGPVGAETPAVTAVGPPPIGRTRLSVRIAPNPVFRSAAIELSGVPAEPITIQIFDVAGRCVRMLRKEERDLRDGTVYWDCGDKDGRRVAGGAYFVRVRAANAEAWGRVVVIR